MIDTDTIENVKITKQHVLDAVNVITNLTVETAEDITFASGALRQLVTFKKELKAKKEAITKPMNKALREVRALFKPAEEGIAKCENQLKTKIAAAQQRQAEERVAALQSLRTNEESTSAEIISTAPEITKPKGITTRFKWVIKSIDTEKLLPQHLKLIPNMETITWTFEHRRDGSKRPENEEPEPIPGIVFVKKSIVSVRSK